MENHRRVLLDGNGKTLKTGISDLENLESETSPENQEPVQMGQVSILIHEEWSPDEWNDDEICVGWHNEYGRAVSS